MSPDLPQVSEETNDLDASTQRLFEAGQRLEELTAGEVDTATVRGGQTFLSKLAQRQLRDSEAAKQAAILDALPAHIALLDSQALIVSVNAPWRRFATANLMRSANYGVGANYLAVCDAALGRESSEASAASLGIRSVLSGHANTFSMEYPCHSPAEEAWYLLTALPLSDHRAGGAVIMHANITEQKQAKEELKLARDAALESARLKADFLSNVSHELLTPMNGVIGMAQLLLDTTLSVEQREFVETIALSGNALLLLINDVLDFSEAESGKVVLTHIAFPVRDLVEDAVKVLEPKALAKGLRLSCCVASGVPATVAGDAARLKQILVILIGNAVKFTDSGTVEVNVTEVTQSTNEATLKFEVRDTGIGIPEKQQRRLFQAFMQADSSLTRKYGGNGMGLAIANQLVELMNGTIAFSTKPGAGSLFWFSARFDDPRCK